MKEVLTGDKLER